MLTILPLIIALFVLILTGLLYMAIAEEKMLQDCDLQDWADNHFS